MKKSKVVFIVDAFDDVNERHELINNTVVEVFADTEQAAVERAKKYINKPKYRIRQIIEKEC